MRVVVSIHLVVKRKDSSAVEGLWLQMRAPPWNGLIAFEKSGEGLEPGQIEECSRPPRREKDHSLSLWTIGHD